MARAASLARPLNPCPMKTNLLHGLSLTLLSLLLYACPPAPQAVDLAWSGLPPDIRPGIQDTLILDDLGIADTVYVLSGTTLQAASKNILNRSGNDLPASADFDIRVRLEQYAFQAVLPASVRYVPTGNFLVDTLLDGPAPIGGLDSALFTANLNQPLNCGMYKLSMYIDPGQDLMETDTSNNLYEDFLFVLSQQQFNIQLNTPEPARVQESVGPNQLAHTYSVLPASPTITNAFYTNFKVQTNMGSTASSAPVPSVNLSPLPALITVRVSPSAPPVDVIENMEVKITVISADGCVIKQRAALIEILHDI